MEVGWAAPAAPEGGVAALEVGGVAPAAPEGGVAAVGVGAPEGGVAAAVEIGCAITAVLDREVDEAVDDCDAAATPEDWLLEVGWGVVEKVWLCLLRRFCFFRAASARLW